MVSVGKDAENLNFFGRDPVNDSVAANDQFSEVFPIIFGHFAAAISVVQEALQLGLYLLGQNFSVSRISLANITAGVGQVEKSLRDPANYFRRHL